MQAKQKALIMNNTVRKRVLLISNSTLYGSGYLDHAESEIRDFLGNVSEALFVPYALYDRDAYAATAQERFQKMGYKLTSIHMATDPQQAVTDAEAVFIGGGNTFRLLKSLYDADVIDSDPAASSRRNAVHRIKRRLERSWTNHLRLRRTCQSFSRLRSMLLD